MDRIGPQGHRPPVLKVVDDFGRGPGDRLLEAVQPGPDGSLHGPQAHLDLGVAVVLGLAHEQRSASQGAAPEDATQRVAGGELAPRTLKG